MLSNVSNVLRQCPVRSSVPPCSPLSVGPTSVPVRSSVPQSAVHRQCCPTSVHAPSLRASECCPTSVPALFLCSPCSPRSECWLASVPAPFLCLSVPQCCPPSVLSNVSVCSVPPFPVLATLRVLPIASARSVPPFLRAHCQCPTSVLSNISACSVPFLRVSALITSLCQCPLHYPCLLAVHRQQVGNPTSHYLVWRATVSLFLVDTVSLFLNPFWAPNPNPQLSASGKACPYQVTGVGQSIFGSFIEIPTRIRSHGANTPASFDSATFSTKLSNAGCSVS